MSIARRSVNAKAKLSIPLKADQLVGRTERSISVVVALGEVSGVVGRERGGNAIKTLCLRFARARLLLLYYHVVGSRTAHTIVDDNRPPPSTVNTVTVGTRISVVYTHNVHANIMHIRAYNIAYVFMNRTGRDLSVIELLLARVGPSVIGRQRQSQLGAPRTGAPVHLTCGIF